MLRTYKIKFNKTYHRVGFSEWEEVSDAYIIESLISLQKIYDFRILSCNIKMFGDASSITIKCNKKNKNAIFSAFCIKLAGKIESINF